MPSADPSAAGVRREGTRLVFTGALVRTAVAALWPQARTQLAGVDGFDLTAVERVDSAGLALLAELAAQAAGPVALAGSPAGLAELRSVYRLDEALGYAS